LEEGYGKVKSNGLRVAQLGPLPTGKHCDGSGLWLHKRRDGGAQWIDRFTLCGRTRGMGLGALRDVGLADAREAADAARRLVAPESETERKAPSRLKTSPGACHRAGLRRRPRHRRQGEDPAKAEPEESAT
jgi:hypothetical protein